MARTPDCHPDRKHVAHGLCSSCYDHARYHGKVGGKAKCHPDRSHKARGLCGPCYELALYHGHFDTVEKLRVRYGKPPTCHPDRPHHSNGLCKTCAETDRLRRNPVSAERRRLGKLTARNADHPLFREYGWSVARQYVMKAWRQHRISAEELLRLFVKQRGKCGICKRPHAKERPLHVDHDHDGGAVRGLLCHNCNVSLGLMSDKVANLMAAGLYLSIHHRKKIDQRFKTQSEKTHGAYA